MNKENAIKFASLMEDYLNIPAFLCERIEKKLEENKYKEVIEFIIYRRKELENKPDYLSEQQIINILTKKDKQLQSIKFYIEQSDIKDMLWGKEILKIIGGNDERK